MHTADARKRGETEERLYLLDTWRDSPLYSARERAALEWTEALTLLSETHAPDDAYRALQAQFTPEEQVELTLTIVAINGMEPDPSRLPRRPSGRRASGGLKAAMANQDAGAAFDPLRPKIDPHRVPDAGIGCGRGGYGPGGVPPLA